MLLLQKQLSRFKVIADISLSKQSDSSQEDKETQLISDTYDPFGINYAIQQATKSQPQWQLIVAKTMDWAVLGIALIPLPLVIVSISLLLIPNISLGVKGVAIIFLLWITLFIAHQCRLFKYSNKLPASPTTKQLNYPSSVIVIGAGPVGLAVVKACVEEGLDVQCFERQAKVGGVFRLNQDFPGGCWPTVRLTTSPWVTAYSDFPPSSTSCKHHTTQEYVSYLEQYVNHFGLWKHLHFRQMVTCVAPEVEADNIIGWRVTTVSQETGETTHHRCDRIAVCAGLNLNPKPINIPGLDTFTGDISHSATYSSPEGVDGKRVVVVGAGESGVDIATEISHVAKETYLSLRRGKFVIPRINPLNGIANDYDTNRIRNAPPIVLRNWFMNFKRKICFYTQNHTLSGACRSQLLTTSEAGPASQTTTKSDNFIDRILAGKLTLRKKIIGFDEDTVIFEDGISQVVDQVIFAHGYVLRFPFLKYPTGIKGRHPGELFLNMFHPEIGNSLAFCGFARPAIGAIPPTGELQARLFAQVAAGKRALPKISIMTRDIIKTRRENAKNFPTQSQPNAVINWIPYMDKIADLIGARPTLPYLLARPRLLWSLCTGPVTGAHYRLQGPGASQISRATVMQLPRVHQLSEIIIYLGLYFWLWPIQIIHPNPNWKGATTLL